MPTARSSCDALEPRVAVPIQQRGLRAGSKTSLPTFLSFFELRPQSSLGYHDLLNANAPTALNAALQVKQRWTGNHDDVEHRPPTHLLSRTPLPAARQRDCRLGGIGRSYDQQAYYILRTRSA